MGTRASKIAPGAGVGVGHHLFEATVASSTLAAGEGEPGDGRVLAIFDTDAGYPKGEAGSSVRQAFPNSRALAYVMLRVNHRDAGPIARARACGASGLDGGHLSAGDRASLPGRSTRYRVIWLVCPHCGIRMAWLFYDERDIPSCVNPLHGRLELQR